MILQTVIDNFEKKFDVVSIFIIVNDRILLLKRQSSKPHEGTWGPPAGKCDLGESLEQAICRETLEEAGIKITPEIISKSKKEYFVRHDEIDFIFHVFSVNFNEEVNVALNSSEHCEYSWLTPKEALELALVPDEEVCICDFFDV